MKQLGIRSITIRKFKNYRNKQNEHSELKKIWSIRIFPLKKT